MSKLSRAYDTLDSLVTQFGDNEDRNALNILWNHLMDAINEAEGNFDTFR